MAKRFDNLAEYLSTTSNLLNYNLPYTVMFWGKISVDTNDYIHFWASCATATESSGNYSHSDLVGTGSDGTTLTVSAYISGGTSSATGTNLTVGTWYHIALVRESTTVLKLYLNGVLNATSTTNISGRNSVAGEYMGRFNGGYPLNGCIDAFKSWNTALTSTEVQAEMNSRPHVKTANQYRNTTFTAGGSSLVDSINGYNWTANGAISDEAGPSQLDAITGSVAAKASTSSTVGIDYIISGSTSAKTSLSSSVYGAVDGSVTAKSSLSSTVEIGYAVSGSTAAKASTSSTIQTSQNTGLEFPNNFENDSAVRMLWSGADLLPRVGHTAIWTIKFSTQTDYYSVAWHTNNDGNWDYGDYSFGTHPWPGNGLFDPTSGNGGEPPGEATGGQGSTVQFYEIAGVTGANDYIRDETGVSLPIVRDVFVTQARSCKTIVGGPDDGKIEHLFWPDISQPTHYFRLLRATAPSTPSDPIFCFGASPWRDNSGGGTGITDEALGGILRGIKLFDEALDFSDIVTEAANETDSPVTSDGIASVWYMNQNPTPDDISDKSGEGHDPTWANAYRPLLWEEPPSFDTDGSITATAETSSTVVVGYVITGETSAKSSTSVNVNQDLTLTGSTSGKSSLSSSVSIGTEFSSTVTGKSATSSSVEIGTVFSGSIFGKADSSASVNQDFLISGTTSGKVSLSHSLEDEETSVEFESTLEAHAEISSTVSIDYVINGFVSCKVDATATISNGFVIGGSTSAKVDSTGTISIGYEIAGSTTAKASSTSSPFIEYNIGGTIAAIAETSAIPSIGYTHTGSTSAKWDSSSQYLVPWYINGSVSAVVALAFEMAGEDEEIFIFEFETPLKREAIHRTKLIREKTYKSKLRYDNED